MSYNIENEATNVSEPDYSHKTWSQELNELSNETLQLSNGNDSFIDAQGNDTSENDIARSQAFFVDALKGQFHYKGSCIHFPKCNGKGNTRDPTLSLHYLTKNCPYAKGYNFFLLCF